MSYYYKYNFTSPEVVYSTIKEELKSYFDTGAVDDMLFPTYLDKCLRKLGRTTYVIKEEALVVEDFETALPEDFYAVREAWLCTEVNQTAYSSANSFYTQAATASTIQVSPIVTDCPNCSPCCGNVGCDGSCMPEHMQTVYKSNNAVARSYRKMYLLKPGNISTKAKCDVGYMDNWEFYTASPAVNEFTPGSASYDSFDIRNGKFITNFRNGVVHLVYYASEQDDCGNQMIPDNYRIREYVEAFIKYKVFETLSNQINDETFDQIQKKLAYYKGLADEAFIMADIEIKKQDPWTKQRRIKNDLNRFNMYELPNRVGRYGWRRN